MSAFAHSSQNISTRDETPELPMTPMRPNESFESTLPDWVGDALREPMQSSTDARERIMSTVRSMPAPRQFAAPMRPSRWMRRGWLSPMGGVMTSALMALALVMRMSGGVMGGSDIETATRILGDSVVPSAATFTNSETGQPTRWLDTLRVVEFVIRGSSIHAASIMGDFNRWQRTANPMVSDGHAWRARVLVPRDVVDVAYLVNGAKIIPASSAAAPIHTTDRHHAADSI